MNLVLRQLKQHIRCKMCAQEQLYTCRRTYMFSDRREWCWIHRSFRLVRIHVSQRVCVEKLWTKGRLCINFTQTDRQPQTDRQTHQQTDWHRHRHTQTQTIFKGYIQVAFCLCVKTSLCEAILSTGSFSCKSKLFSYQRFCAKWPVYLIQMLTIWNGHKIHSYFCSLLLRNSNERNPLPAATSDLNHWHVSYNLLHVIKMTSLCIDNRPIKADYFRAGSVGLCQQNFEHNTISGASGTMLALYYSVRVLYCCFWKLWEL